jgi:hypothetical protein
MVSCAPESKADLPPKFKDEPGLRLFQHPFSLRKMDTSKKGVERTIITPLRSLPSCPSEFIGGWEYATFILTAPGRSGAATSGQIISAQIHPLRFTHDKSREVARRSANVAG